MQTSTFNYSLPNKKIEFQTHQMYHQKRWMLLKNFYSDFPEICPVQKKIVILIYFPLFQILSLFMHSTIHGENIY